MDPITVTVAGILVLAAWALVGSRDDDDNDTAPSDELVPGPGPDEPGEAPPLLPPVFPDEPIPGPGPDEPPAPVDPILVPPAPPSNGGLTAKEKARQKVQQRLQQLGYAVVADGKRTAGYIAAVKLFQSDVRAGQNYYAGRPDTLAILSKPASQGGGSVVVDGLAGKQVDLWLSWAIKNQSTFTAITVSATGSNPGS